MNTMADYPIVLFVLSFLGLWLATRFGATVLRRKRALEQEEREDFHLIQAATLTLLGLIIGFTFSMAISRYDLRKNSEETEANAIGTEYARADLLPAADGARLRTLLKDYLKQRILFYVTRDEQQVRRINARTAQLQGEMWAAVVAPAKAQATPLTALVISGMNDVLNSQGYTQAAWWNRIPLEARILLLAIALCCTVMLGYGTRSAKAKGFLFLVLPFVVSLSYFLIIDIDSPRSGVIRVIPENLMSLAESMRAR